MKMDSRIKYEKIAMHAIQRIYSFVTTLLHRRRDAAKIVFFEDLGYLFTSWEQHGTVVTQQTLKLWWNEKDMKVVSYEDIPEVQASTNDNWHSQDWEVEGEGSVSALNAKKMSDLIAEHPYLILMAEHDVNISEDSKGHHRGRRGIANELPVKRMTRPINLLAIACKILPAYIGIDNTTLPTTFVSTHEQSLRCAFVLSVMLRDLCSKFVDEYDKNGVSWLHGNVTLVAMDVYEVALQDLLPSKSKQRETLLNNVLRVTGAEFQQRHVSELSRTSQLHHQPSGETSSPIPLDDDANMFSMA